MIINHKTEKGIGGGNCQVSSTLYNAILLVPSLEVLERHEHGKDVTYVPDGKDAAVSYGSLDLKFKNNSNKSIRIEASSNNSSITIRLVEF
ncbi:MAG: VanW family protein [Clostridiaceae bacterium]|nr:VanW family protein [Clostridiaceae bacterium]